MRRSTTGRGLAEAGKDAAPGEAGAGIGLATGRDVAVRGEIAQRQRAAQPCDQRAERAVLRFLEGRVVSSFELDADREVVARAAAAPGRNPGVPRAAIHRDELDQ